MTMDNQTKHLLNQHIGLCTERLGLATLQFERMKSHVIGHNVDDLVQARNTVGVIRNELQGLLQMKTALEA
jgi:hypothetical protein